MPTATLPSLIPSPQAVERFRAIYATRFGVELPEDRALELATYTLRLVYIGTTPLPSNDTAPPSVGSLLHSS